MVRSFVAEGCSGGAAESRLQYSSRYGCRRQTNRQLLGHDLALDAQERDLRKIDLPMEISVPSNSGCAGHHAKTRRATNSPQIAKVKTGRMNPRGVPTTFNNESSSAGHCRPRLALNELTKNPERGSGSLVVRFQPRQLLHNIQGLHGHSDDPL